MEKEGIITEKKAYTGDSTKAPVGDIYIDSDKFTCWDKELFNKFSIGNEVSIIYTEKENQYNGKTYVNRNISSISEISETNQSPTEQESENKFISEPFKVDGKTYKIVGKLELQ